MASHSPFGCTSFVGRRRHIGEPIQGLRKGQGAPDRRSRDADRNLGKGAFGIGAQTVLAEQQPRRGEQSPLEEVPPVDLALGEGFDDLPAIVPRVLRFPIRRFDDLNGKYMTAPSRLCRSHVSPGPE